MDYGILFTLLGIGFFVGLSGALIPGPLLVFVISDSMKKGKWSGPLTIVGHSIVELLIVAVIVLGLGPYITSFEGWIFLFGGLMLVGMASTLIRSSGDLPELGKGQGMNRKQAHGSIAGGVAFTLFNPSFPLWWATAGYSLLLYGMQALGLLGLILVVLGHWGADFGYYFLVSYLISHGREKVLNRIYRPLMFILSLFLIVLGAFFAFQGLSSIGILSPSLL